MKYPFFASFIVFCLWLMYEIHKKRNSEAKKYQEFVDRENEANSTRKKSLDDLAYISIPFEKLPMDILADDERISEYIDTIRFLSEKPIVNLTGISNTDLKLKYGAANLDTLSKFDEAYTTLVRTLNSWAYALYENDRTNEARDVLEYTLSTGTDVKKSFILLAKIYKETNQSEKIKELISVASESNSLISDSIVSELTGML